MADSESKDSPIAPLPSPSRWPRRIAAAAAVVALVAVGGTFFLSRALDSERVAGWLEPRISEAVNRPVRLGGAGVGVFPMRVSLTELTLEDPTGLAPHLATLDALELRVRLLPLIRKQVVVREIRLTGLSADLRVGSDGGTNFGDFSPATEPGAGGGEAGPAGEVAPASEESGAGPNPFALSLDNIRLDGWDIRYESQPDSQAVALTDLAGDAAVRRDAAGNWSFDADWTGTLQMNDGPAGTEQLAAGLPTALRASLGVSEDFATLEISEGELSLDAVSLAVTGRVDGLTSPRREVDLRLNGDGIQLGDVLASLPARESGPELSGSGTLSARLQAVGTVGGGERPVVSGDLHLRGGALAVDGEPVASALEVDVDLLEDRSLRPVLTGRVLGGSTRITGRILTTEGIQMDLQAVGAPILDAIPGRFIPAGVELSGAVPTDIRIVGSPDNVAELGIWGVIGVQNLRVVHPATAQPVGVASANLTVADGQADLSPAEVTLGPDPFQVRGTFAGLLDALDGGLPQFRGRAAGPRLDLVAISPDPPADTSLTYGRVAFAQVGGRRVRGVSAQDAAREMGLARPVGLPFQGEVELAVDTVLDRRGRMRDLRATVLFSPELIQLTNATFGRYGGRIQASGSLRLGQDTEEPFSLQLRATGVDAAAFLGETTPLGRAVRGTMDLNVDLAGAVDALLLPSRTSLQGAGSFSLTNGSLGLGELGGRMAGFLGVEGLRTPTVQSWRSGFILRDGLVVLDEAAVQGAPGDPRVGGGVGLDGGLDLVTAFDLPREDLAAGAVSRLGLPESLAGADVVSAVLRVGGSLADPAVRADPGASVRSAAAGVQDRAREEIRQEVAEQRETLRERASGLVSGFLGRTRTQPPPPDTVRATPVDSASAADSVRADTLPGDTAARPDTTRPDTTRTDTGSTGITGPGPRR